MPAARAYQFGMVNEMAIMCDKLGIDVWEVINAAATKPFGFMPFQPGPGVGRDTFCEDRAPARPPVQSHGLPLTLPQALPYAQPHARPHGLPCSTPCSAP